MNWGKGVNSAGSSLITLPLAYTKYYSISLAMVINDRSSGGTDACSTIGKTKNLTQFLIVQYNAARVHTFFTTMGY